MPLEFTFYGSGASGAFKSRCESFLPSVEVPKEAFSKNSFVRIFGKPVAHVGRRMAVTLVFDEVEKAKLKAKDLVLKMRG